LDSTTISFPARARKVATIQYALLIGLQHICSEIPTYDFKELQNMLLEKFEIKQ